MSRSNAFWLVIVCILAFRLVYFFMDSMPMYENCLGPMIKGSGYITEEPEDRENGQVLIISGSFSSSEEGLECDYRGKVKMKVSLYPKYLYGDHIEYTGKAVKPFNFGGDDGRFFNYEGYLSKDDIYYEIRGGKVSGITSDENDVDKNFSISGYLFKYKNIFVDDISRVLGEPHSALASGLVVGEKSALGKELLEDFRIVGLIHIVVLSGFNITIVGEALRRMLVLLPRVWGIVIGGAAISLFGIMVGGGATVVRSCFMAIVALSADLLRRDYDVIRALIFAGVIMVIINPKILFWDPSFQLSFLATAGLIILAKPIEDKLVFITEKFGLRGIVASTLATQIFVSPFILYTMGNISIIGMVVNILVLPFVPLTMLVVFFTGFSGMIYEPISIFFGWIAHLLLSYELYLVKIFSDIPHASIHVPKFSVWWVVVFYIIFFIIRLKAYRSLTKLFTWSSFWSR